MELKQLKEVLSTVNGATFAGIDTAVGVKLKGGKKNPMQGRVTKHTTGSNVILYANTDDSPYKAMVQRRMEAEGKDPSTFELKPRAWGVRDGKTPIILHNDKAYLEVIFIKGGKSQYFLDDEPIAKEDIEGMDDEPVETEASKASQGGIEDKVVIRTYSLDSIKELRLMGQAITS